MNWKRWSINAFRYSFPSTTNLFNQQGYNYLWINDGREETFLLLHIVRGVPYEMGELWYVKKENMPNSFSWVFLIFELISFNWNFPVLFTFSICLRSPQICCLFATNKVEYRPESLAAKRLHRLNAICVLLYQLAIVYQQSTAWLVLIILRMQVSSVEGHLCAQIELVWESSCAGWVTVRQASCPSLSDSVFLISRLIQVELCEFEKVLTFERDTSEASLPRPLHSSVVGAVVLCHSMKSAGHNSRALWKSRSRILSNLTD